MFKDIKFIEYMPGGIRKLYIIDSCAQWYHNDFTHSNVQVIYEAYKQKYLHNSLNVGLYLALNKICEISLLNFNFPSEGKSDLVGRLIIKSYLDRYKNNLPPGYDFVRG